MRAKSRSTSILFWCGIPLLLSLIVPHSMAFAEDAKPEFFNGIDFTGWVTEKGKPVEQGWEIIDGIIHIKRKKGEKRIGHILTTSQHENFTLEFEWKLTEGTNSGIKYRVRNYDGKLLGCEYQINDEGKTRFDAHSTGALYALFAPSDQKALNPIGEFNHGKIVVQGNHIEHWLNGKKIVDVEVGSQKWEERVAESKFNIREGFGENRAGQIMLTDHAGEIWYRNLKFQQQD
ncbi:protein of unknown function [Neorhodopirellula lusitana]|uniref:3-keto-alpha-glucoside-1,2-lyase/3-keto-2-hydroxy-glucal hydratase domain-containing protein n=1 Tax=Neorhodopirellula lusitana TaxID=445327 RepID=A0ABY1PNU3_9BACT|nr:DUF1080 domain-containing protein [Neorhodopirellula lusitana]SMP38867.1 protein of unknown function [Neorhodopirellula lusitana]